MFINLIHTVTEMIQDTWTLLVTHPAVTIPGIALAVGTMVLVNRKNSVHN